ncbi:hypothetical protein [Dipodfec virus UOA04_Rod_558]|nr:hypothetical protein [Dipodfec virus UOA04_Rod_558]
MECSNPFNGQVPTPSVFEPSPTLVVNSDSDGNICIRPLEAVSLQRSDYTLASLLLAGIDPNTISFDGSCGSRLQKSQELDSINLDEYFPINESSNSDN